MKMKPEEARGMARPAKPIPTQAASMTKEARDGRAEAETRLRGECDAIAAPAWLTEGQQAIFDFVVAEMAASGILGNLDTYILTQFAVVADRVFEIERLINEDTDLRVQNKELIAARNSYARDFWRGMNELSLSPQARAKIGSLSMAKKEEEKDPLKKLLAGKG